MNLKKVREREQLRKRERRIDQEGERDRNLKEISRRHKKRIMNAINF